MADNVAITAGAGTTIAADEVTDATLGTAKVQFIKLMDGSLGGTEKATVKAASTAAVATDPALVVALSPNGQNANGQATMANSTPVAIASDQTDLPVRGPVADDAAASGNPVPVGGKYNSAEPTYTNGDRTQLQMTATGALIIGGFSADDAAATGNPIAVGGKVNTTKPTYSDGDRAQLQFTIKGDTVVGGPVADNAAAGADADMFPVPMGGKYNSTAPTYADGDRVQAQFSSRGSLSTFLTNSSGTNISSSAPANDTAAALTGLATWSQGAVFGATQWERMRSILGSFGAGTGVAAVEQAGSAFVWINTATTTQVKNGAGILHKIIINTPVAGTISIIDNTAGTTVNVGLVTMTADLKPYALEYNLAFATGLRIITSVACDITVVYR